MEKLNRWLMETLAPATAKISAQRHLAAMRDGLVATLSLSLVGALSLLIATLPFPSYVAFMAAHPVLVALIKIPFQLTLGVLSVYVAFGIGYSLAKSYAINPLSGGMVSVLSFLIMVGVEVTDKGAALLVANLGGGSMFTAILAAFFSVELMRLCMKHGLRLKLPDSVPPIVAVGFDPVIPMVISATILTIVVHVFGFNINKILMAVIAPLLSGSADSIIVPLVYVTLVGIMWFAGVHPMVLYSIMLPIWTVSATENAAALAAGLPIPHIGVTGFLFTFVFMGGQMGTLPLNFLMLFSKSKTLKSLGRVALAPSLVNINEPILFGLPMVMNPILMIPGLIAMIVTVITTYLAFSTGLVPPMGNALAMANRIPVFINGFLGTGSWRGLALVIVNFCIYLGIYLPFFKIEEKRFLSQEAGEKHFLAQEAGE